MTGNEVRRKFLDYFKSKGHQIVRSSSLVPRDDPTLLFVNAGMVQFKRCFLGEDKRSYNKATTSQKCVRAGGKHNDLENVGYTARHHTFFEMLGNFSFGDYFKEKAIEYCWDLVVNEYGLPPDKLWVSIYLDDDEAGDLWHKNIGVPLERIKRFDEKDNFWAMGDTGPCGPCSEIHLDRGEEFGCGRPECTLGCECDRFLEIWNLVFMQFDRDESGKLTPLPKPSIDTGMGLERMATIVQNTPSNYETDLILPIIHKAEDLAEVALGAGHDSDVALKVIADHSRATAFLIGDGILPSNEGRGYVLRRIMRRAIRYGRNIGLDKPFLYKTSEAVIDHMKNAYPELEEGRAFITNVIENEEARFSETLDFGLRLLTDTLSEMEAKQVTTVPGDVIFKLYDTYGFPVDIVRDVVRDRKMSLDMEGFDTRMAAQRERSRSKAAFSQTQDAYKALSAEGFTPVFVGYDTLSASSNIRLLAKDGQEVQTAGAGDMVELVADTTPFYAESGGQVGDVGRIYADAFEIRVKDTIKDPNDIIVHKGEVVKGTVEKGVEATFEVDADIRRKTACNHTATHILHFALRKVLGDHVKQAGSSVGPDRFRFDFTHFSRITARDVLLIEALVNERVRQNVAVDKTEMDAEEAIRSGATALFEEKYDERVRVITLADFSRELCGGTHTGRTGDIGFFKIASEQSVAAGVRRIEALTGAAAVAHAQAIESAAKKAALLLKDAPEHLPDRLEKLLSQVKTLEKELAAAKTGAAASAADDLESAVEQVGGVRFLAIAVEAQTPPALRDLADRFKDKMGSGVVVLGAASQGKAMLVVCVSRDLTERFNAGDIVKAAAAAVGGTGGGRPDMAQAGGPKPENLKAALDAARAAVATS